MQGDVRNLSDMATAGGIQTGEELHGATCEREVTESVFTSKFGFMVRGNPKVSVKNACVGSCTADIH